MTSEPTKKLPDGPKAIAAYNYQNPQTSPFYDYFLSPLCGWLVEHVVPLKTHPDILSWLGAAAAGVAALVTTYPIVIVSESVSYFLVAILWIFYSLLDNMDGKQARRSGMSSRGGEFLDHALDSLVVSFATVVWRRVLSDNHPPAWQLPLMVFAGQFPIFIGHWGHYVLGRLLLGTRVDAADCFTVDEFNCLYLPGLCLMRAVLPKFFATPLFSLSAQNPLAGFIAAVGAAGRQPEAKALEGVIHGSIGETLMWMMMTFCFLGSLRVVVKLLIVYTGAQHLKLLVPGLLHAVVVCCLPITELRAIWAFTLCCAEILAARLKVHNASFLRLVWPVAAEVLVTLLMRRHEGASLERGGAEKSSQIDWAMFAVSLGLLAHYRRRITQKTLQQKK